MHKNVFILESKNVTCFWDTQNMNAIMTLKNRHSKFFGSSREGRQSTDFIMCLYMIVFVVSRFLLVLLLL